MLPSLTDTHSGANRSAPFWRLTLAMMLCVITWLAIAPAPPKSASLGWDKVNHFAAFATLAVVACLGFARAWIRVALALLAYGALIEVLQSFTPTRSAEWGDLLADGLGIASGLLLVGVVVSVASRASGPSRV